jgi:hypothetical protein
MNPIAKPIGLVLPACGFPVAEGFSTLPITDVRRPGSATIGPAGSPGFSVPTDFVTRAVHRDPSGGVGKRDALGAIRGRVNCRLASTPGLSH